MIGRGVTSLPYMSEMISSTRFSFRHRAGALLGLWRRRWVRVLSYLALLAIVGLVGIWAVFARDLPSAETLLNYEPPLPSNVRGIDGNPVQTFARERRVQLSFDEYPPLLIQAFLSAEDKTFFEHGGIDYAGIVSAVIQNARSGGRPVGASTITQQVAKNLLLTNEVSYTRKIKEAFLARRIEDVLSKQQILELYLNQIFLGRNAYGVQSAARAYFNKDVDGLSLHEMAYLAVLPKAPSNYSPERQAARATARRNYVLKEMEENGFITASFRQRAAAEPIGAVPAGRVAGFTNVGGYYMEEVRRTLIGQYGEDDKKGVLPNSVYAGGLWVRTSYDPKLQDAAAEALRDGLVRFEGGGRWRDPGLSIDVDGNWAGRLATAKFGPGYDDWRSAVVLSKSGSSAELGFTDGSTGTLPSYAASMPKRGTSSTAFSFLRPGMIIAVKKDGNTYALRSVPEISGGFVAQQVRTGRVLAMQGGWDIRGKDFNRATQANRQPGSTFKPFVYATALDNGMTPASIIPDAPFSVYQGPGLGWKTFRNFANQGGAGPQTMRWGLEQSRNLMTVRTASQIGMPKIVRTAERMGVSPPGKPYAPFLGNSLGAGDTTVMQITNAYAMMANNGKALKPTLIDYVQDRRGKVIFRADTRECPPCTARYKDWDGRPMPRPPVRTKQAMDPMTAYQMVHILEGVVERGTATTLRDLKRPLFGKTGTTTGPRDVWFVGGSPDIVAGLYIGYDQPRDMGHGAQGGRIAAPIFKQFAQVAYKDMPVTPFVAPAGVRMVRIDRRSGRRVYGGWPTGEDPKSAVIWEAFKPESEPKRAIRRDRLVQPAVVRMVRKKTGDREVVRRADSPQRQEPADDFLEKEGGIY
ncbi:MAG: Multimodular transpeptidase-transglycosylase [uncultured Sphingomonadaceae bacterium]|uniref:Penicillin-binding protein 1A n=1 Tax=uncultured Sphingomonadaceae bacterium TaxID=169976 RepID=A0A6J4RWB1_9SPHN|nr:MAG: Multimodular transpeptidase-transglycosylase [uncultured Sphingomonadaceae bacterium]